jgi:hypothetical protein
MFILFGWANIYSQGFSERWLFEGSCAEEVADDDTTTSIIVYDSCWFSKIRSFTAVKNIHVKMVGPISLWWLASASNMTSLNLENVRFDRFPSSRFPFLRSANLSGNELSDPSFLFDRRRFPNLYEVVLYNCKVRQLKLKGNNGIKRLDLTENHKINLEGCRSKLNLDYISLRSCEISNLPSTIDKIRCDSLDISQNNIRFLDLRNLHSSVRYLDVSFNPIEKMSIGNNGIHSIEEILSLGSESYVLLPQIAKFSGLKSMSISISGKSIVNKLFPLEHAPLGLSVLRLYGQDEGTSMINTVDAKVVSQLRLLCLNRVAIVELGDEILSNEGLTVVLRNVSPHDFQPMLEKMNGDFLGKVVFVGYPDFVRENVLSRYPNIASSFTKDSSEYFGQY